MYALFGVESVNGVRVIVLDRELVAKGFTEPELAKYIVRLTPESERREIRFHFIGHDAFAKRGSANTIAEQMDPYYQQAGLPRLDRADIDRVGGARLLYNAFASARRLRNHDSEKLGPFEDRAEDTPALFISAECVETVKALPTRVMDDKNRMDVLKVDDMEDNVYDAIRYGVKSFIAADPSSPVDVQRAEILQRYQTAHLTPQQHGGADANQTNLCWPCVSLKRTSKDGMFLRRRLRR